jgi:excisionase family DNA binding protein
MQESTATRKLVRAYDVARIFGYSTSTIKKWARDGKLPGAVFIDRHVRFDLDQVEQFIRNGGKRSNLKGAGSEPTPTTRKDILDGREYFKHNRPCGSSQSH